MHLPRHTIESHADVPLFQHASFCSPDPAIFNTSTRANAAHRGAHSGAKSPDEVSQPAVLCCASLNGFLVARTDPLKLVANRSWSSSQGGLSHVVPVQHSSLLFLVGGSRVPRFAPNKVVLWDEAAEYTVKAPAGISRDGDSDDDDDLGSITSRRASTIFSAGSEFDAYGKTRPGDTEHGRDPATSRRRSPSPADSLRFSTSSLVDADDLPPDNHASSTHAPVLPMDDRDETALAYSVGASSLGIGRLQASTLSDTSVSRHADSIVLDDNDTDLASSRCSHSIMASSANLADPFAEEDTQHTAARSSPSTRKASITSRSVSEISAAAIDSKGSAAPAMSSRQRLFSGQNSPQAGAGLVDSVSSMATTATDATAKAQPQILRGREVAELEFSEVVRGIYATSVQDLSTKTRNESVKGKGRASSEAASARRASGSRMCIVLVVVLTSKAVIFELSPPSGGISLGGLPKSSAWKIQKRAAVQTYKNPKGLGSVAPYLSKAEQALSEQASAIVAVPGRQKGHIQLLRIVLQSSTSVASAPALSNPSSSIGAASIIVAHESSIAAIALSPNGHVLASASSKGTLIRIWSNIISGGGASDTDTGRHSKMASKLATAGRTGFGAKLVRELRRGTDPATILSIAFAPDASLVAAASDKGTIHIFLLTDHAGTTPASGEQGRSSTSSASRAANFGRAAAQYLPAGIGNLAGQIPPSVLPHYLKSEWSSAQYRIPLKSFGASSRHYSVSSASDEGAMYGASATPAAPVGTEKSTEGAWAQMRSRISDIRKGEASVDEKIFLCWIVEASASSGSTSPLASKSARADAQRSRVEQADKSRTRASATLSDEPDLHEADGDPRHRYRLIAVTTSGGWYKLAITIPKASEEDSVKGSTVLDMYRQDASASSKWANKDKANAMECRLLEFRPMVALLDGWRA